MQLGQCEPVSCSEVTLRRVVAFSPEGLSQRARQARHDRKRPANSSVSSLTWYGHGTGTREAVAIARADLEPPRPKLPLDTASFGNSVLVAIVEWVRPDIDRPIASRPTRTDPGCAPGSIREENVGVVGTASRARVRDLQVSAANSPGAT